MLPDKIIEGLLNAKRMKRKEKKYECILTSFHPFSSEASGNPAVGQLSRHKGPVSLVYWFSIIDVIHLCDGWFRLISTDASF